MSTITRRKHVEFVGIDIDLEDKKTNQGTQIRKTRRERKKAKKMVKARERRNSKLFLRFLRDACTLDERRSRLGGLDILYPEIEDAGERLELFEDLLISGLLHFEHEDERDYFYHTLQAIERFFRRMGYYTDLDKFLQELSWEDQEGRAVNWLGTVPLPHNLDVQEILELDWPPVVQLQWAEEFVRALRRFRDGLGTFRASSLSIETQNSLSSIMDSATTGIVEVSSSEDSSDDELQDEEF